MNSKTILLLRVALGLLAIFFGYKIYQLINEPLEFEKIKQRRYDVVKERLVMIRDAQNAYKDEFNRFCEDIDWLVAFVDTGMINIVERKDSSFAYYDKLYQTDMIRDTVVIRVIGRESVKNWVFKDTNFDANKLMYIPFSNGERFFLDATVLERRGIRIPVFEVSAPNSAIFQDLSNSVYRDYIDYDFSLTVGSLTEPKFSGNW
jgi:hypothetical protein